MGVRYRSDCLTVKRVQGTCRKPYNVPEENIWCRRGCVPSKDRGFFVRKAVKFISVIKGAKENDRPNLLFLQAFFERLWLPVSLFLFHKSYNHFHAFTGNKLSGFM